MLQAIYPVHMPNLAKFQTSETEPSQSHTTNISFISQTSCENSITDEPPELFSGEDSQSKDELLASNKMLMNFYQNEEDNVMSYTFMDHQNLLPFEVFYSNDSLVLSHEKKMAFNKCRSLMSLLALKQQNLVESYMTSRHLLDVIRKNENLAQGMNVFMRKEQKKKTENAKNAKKAKNAKSKMMIFKKKIKKVKINSKFF